jgi:ankyrin repeat protein
MSKWEPKTDKLISYLIKAVPESLNAKSSNGRTPLQLAFALRLPSVAKLLIDAGAEIEVIDKKGNNLMHALFTIWRQPGWNSAGAPFDHQDIEKLIALLDKATVKKLLLRRNNYTEGAQTPLQAWLSQHNAAMRNEDRSHVYCIKEHGHCCCVATLDLLLIHSGNEALNMVDGTGDTAVHAVVSQPKAHYLQAMLKVNPDCIFRENAVGRTPAEVARDGWLKEQVSDPPIVGTGKQYWNAPDRAKNLTARDVNWFITCSEPESPVAKVWNLCREQIELCGGQQKRRLVSLAEANEVAKRLGEKQRAINDLQLQNHIAHQNGIEMPIKDEVELWFVDRLKTINDRVYGGCCPPVKVSM